jgi:hypothetical protein
VQQARRAECPRRGTERYFRKFGEKHPGALGSMAVGFMGGDKPLKAVSGPAQQGQCAHQAHFPGHTMQNDAATYKLVCSGTTGMPRAGVTGA